MTPSTGRSPSALQSSITAKIDVTNSRFLDSTYNAIMLVSDYSVKDQYPISHVHFKNLKVDGTGTSVLSARSAGSATFQDVQARNVGAVGSNNCGSFNCTPDGSELTVLGQGQQHRRRDHRALAGPVGAAQHDHLRLPSAGGRAAGAGPVAMSA